VEHAVKTAGQQLALLEHGAGMAAHARVGLQVGGGGEQIGDDQLLDTLAGQLAALEDFTGKAGAEEAGATGDKNAHGVTLDRVLWGVQWLSLGTKAPRWPTRKSRSAPWSACSTWSM